MLRSMHSMKSAYQWSDEIAREVCADGQIKQIRSKFSALSDRPATRPLELGELIDALRGDIRERL